MAGEDRRPRAWVGARTNGRRLLGAPGVAQVTHWAASRFAPERDAQRWPVPWTVRRVRGVVGGEPFVMLDPSRCRIATELYWGRGRRGDPGDQSALEVFARLARDSDHVLDIGAGTGIFTLVAATHAATARVDAYELVPQRYLALVRNLVANDQVSGRVQAHLGGVGSATTVRVLARDVVSPVSDFGGPDDLGVEASVEVPTISLDSLLDVTDAANRVLVRIDLGGDEAMVLRHGEHFLERHHPTLVCEILPPQGETDELNDIIGPLGYRCFLITRTGLVRRDRVRGDLGGRDWLITVLGDGELVDAGIPLS